MFDRRRVRLPIQLRPEAGTFEGVALSPVAGHGPVFHLWLPANPACEAVAEGVAAVLAGGDVIEARRLALHVRPAGIIKVRGSVDVPHVAGCGVGVAQDDLGRQQRQRAGDKPAFGIARHVVMDPKAVQLDHVLRRALASSDQHVMAGRRPEGDATLGIAEVIYQPKAKRYRRLAVHVMMRDHKGDSFTATDDGNPHFWPLLVM